MNEFKQPDSGTLTHLDAEGRANMVDVSEKEPTNREAQAQAWIRMRPSTLKLIQHNGHPKGDVFAVARIAGIMAAKKAHELIPLCHPLMLSSIHIEVKTVEPDSVRIVSTCRLNGRTGVELEALTAASVAALTIYDMCKAVDRGMIIDRIQLLKKQGGRSGHFEAGAAQ